MKQVKKLILLLFISILLVSCSNSETDVAPFDQEETDITEDELEEELDEEETEGDIEEAIDTPEDEEKKESNIFSKEIQDNNLNSKATTIEKKTTTPSNQSSSNETNNKQSTSKQKDQKTTSSNTSKTSSKSSSDSSNTSKSSTKSSSNSSNSSKQSSSGKSTKETSHSKSSNEQKKPEQAVTVSVSIPNGVSGSGLSPTTVTIQEGDTVLDATKKTGINIKFRGSGASAYVNEINGLREFDEGPFSGWLVRVDGVEIDRSAGAYTIKSNQRIEWTYTTDFTK